MYTLQDKQGNMKKKHAHTNLIFFHAVTDLDIYLSSNTVLSAHWVSDLGVVVDNYTLTCSVNKQNVLLVDTRETSLAVGIYWPYTTYVCQVWYTTISGEIGPATSEVSVTTGGE